MAELGHGGMADVYLAVVRGPAGFNKLVVLKRIRPQLASDPEFITMFLDEARLAARLSHPNIVQTNEVCQEDDRTFIAMEYLEGQPLNRISHRLQKTGGLPLGMHLKIVCDALAGLHYAHEVTDYDGTPLGVVHRDVTPHNVFVTYDGQVKVVDFGVAKAHSASSETRVGVLKGKVAYMAPEQARGERVDRRADVFSIGVLLWEAAVGRRLWRGVPDLTILERLVRGDIPTPRSVKPDVPEALEAIILKAIAHRREDRHASAAELQSALEAYIEDAGFSVHPRDLGKTIVSAFSADRAKIRTIIEEQLRAGSSSASGPRELPILDPPTHSEAASSSKVELARTATSTGMSYSQPMALFATAGATADGGGRRGLVAAAALCASVLLAVAFWEVTESSPPAMSAPALGVPTAAPASLAAASPIVVAQRDGDVEITVSVAPAEAKMFLDDAPLSGNPAKITVAKDGVSHELRVEAPGYVTKTDRLTFERDRSMDVVLAKEAPAKDAAPRQHLAGPVAPRDETNRAGARKPQRTLDTANPYEE